MLRLWQVVTHIHQHHASSPHCFNLISLISDNELFSFLKKINLHRTKSGGNQETFAAAVRVCSPGKC